jgi:hypothetical protein
MESSHSLWASKSWTNELAFGRHLPPKLVMQASGLSPGESQPLLLLVIVTVELGLLGLLSRSDVH